MYKQIQRPNKEFFRSLFFSQVKKPARWYFCLPSGRAECVKQSMAVGAINENTEIVGVERDRRIFSRAARTLDKLGVEYNLTNDHLHNVELDKRVDLAYVDICGLLTSDVLLWTRHLYTHLTDNALVAFTFVHTRRSHDTFYNRLHNGMYGFEEPKYTAGFVKRTDSIDLICGALSSMMDGIRFNIVSTYQDSSLTMTFLGGYFGRKPVMNILNYDKLEGRINHLLKNGAQSHQEYGGLKIMWNRCENRSYFLKKFGKRKLKRVGLSV